MVRKFPISICEITPTNIEIHLPDKWAKEMIGALVDTHFLVHFYHDSKHMFEFGITDVSINCELSIYNKVRSPWMLSLKGLATGTAVEVMKTIAFRRSRKLLFGDKSKDYSKDWEIGFDYGGLPEDALGGENPDGVGIRKIDEMFKKGKLTKSKKGITI